MSRLVVTVVSLALLTPALAARPYQELRRWVLEVPGAVLQAGSLPTPPGGFPPLPPGASRTMFAEGMPLRKIVGRVRVPSGRVVVIDHYGAAGDPAAYAHSHGFVPGTTAPAALLPPGTPGGPPHPAPAPPWPPQGPGDPEGPGDAGDPGDPPDCEDPSQDPHDRDRDAAGERRRGEPGWSPNGAPPRGPCEDAHGTRPDPRGEGLAQRLLRERRERNRKRLAEQAARRRRLLGSRRR